MEKLDVQERRKVVEAEQLRAAEKAEPVRVQLPAGARQRFGPLTK
jgi:hypothetical protein